MEAITPQTDSEFYKMYDVCEKHVLVRDTPSDNPTVKKFKNEGRFGVDTLMVQKHFSYADKEYSVRLVKVDCLHVGTGTKEHSLGLRIKQYMEGSTEAEAVMDEDKRVETKLEKVFNIAALARLRGFTLDGKAKLPHDIQQALNIGKLL